MVIPTQAVVDRIDGSETQHHCRKHLQRLIRKVQHVLIVKHCIDDLRRAARHPKRSGNRAGLPGNAVVLPEINNDLKTAANCLVGPRNSALVVGDLNAKSTLKRLLRAPVSEGGLHAVENFLDTYVVNSYDWVRRCQQQIGCVTSKALKNWDKKSAHVSAKINWAKKRSFSVKDNRSLALLVKLLGPAGQLDILQGYLETYIIGNSGIVRETLSEVVNRLRVVFGVGWFFEWPSGRHPLNSTWPWADVKPSLLVLWGVCWMFFGNMHASQHYRQPFGHNLQNTMRSPWASSLDLMQPNNFQNFQNGPVPNFPNFQLSPQIPRQRQPVMQGFPHSGYYEIPAAEGINDSSQPAHIQSPSPLPANTSDLYLRDHRRPISSRDREVTNHEARNLSAGWSSVTALGESSRNLSSQATGIHHQRQHRNTTNERLPYLQQADILYATLMPPSNTFNYPPLDTIADLQDQVYQNPERVFNHLPISDPHEYEHADHPQEPPRYPSPPPPLSENPYNAQRPTQTPDSRIDMPVEPKSESDAPSPGRSKPVPKPDREVTKDANGRFYCNWPNCTEEQRDFGRKCEWSKHMDKHDRPYKCPAEGCEKLPGFTYSGGLLRHEREVHNKHGGPRKQLNCPHLNCKRHTGKGFSRQENLNEHLRRVHTDAGPVQNGEETEEDGGDLLAGGKRKRTRVDSQDLREEMKRLRQENEDLRRQAEAQNRQSAEMMHQIIQLQASLRHPTMQPPPAQMT